MQNADLEKELQTVLKRPDLLVVAKGLHIDLDPSQKIPLSLRRIKERTFLQLGGASPRFLSLAPTFVRYGIELFHLLEAGITPIVASFASARIAAQFHLLDVADACPLPLFLSPFISEHPDEKALLHRVSDLCTLLPDLTVPNEQEHLNGIRTVIKLWSLLAPTETLMSGGGDSRLAINTQTGLNRYSCSHRPRPWAVAFGSSTASSLSERGFDGAEAARRSMIAALLSGENPDTVQSNKVLSVRKRLGQHFNISADQVILNASGTDCELAALSLVAAQTTRPITTILIAPDETGSGVPLAAQGKHFASDSVCAETVNKGEPIKGFPNNTKLISIPIRTPEGLSRTRKEIDEECQNIALSESEKGHHVLLHRLDQSKTGMVAPSITVVENLMQQIGENITIVVDACQARVSPSRITQWIEQGMMVMLTGSKFFTGPPFCGALLLPTFITKSLRHAPLPVGLKDYSHQSEWPNSADRNALSEGYNLGLVFRWEAALAEMDALFSHSNDIIRERLSSFMKAVKIELCHYPKLEVLPPPSLGNDPLWDGIPTILSFLVKDPRSPNQPLDLENARRLHRWLNSDLTQCLPHPSEGANLLCVLGQPVPVSHKLLKGPAGALRLCAGARLVSGEPSHYNMNEKERMAQECHDVRRVLKKIILILENWSILLEANPIPRYAPFSSL